MLQPPRWCANAVPTARGWADPQTGELYVARRFSQEDIDRYNGLVEVHDSFPEVLTEVEVEEPAPQMLNEAPANHKSLEDMTKTELLALAEQQGVKVSRFNNKATIIEKLS